MLPPVVFLRPHKPPPWGMGFLSFLALLVVLLPGSWGWLSLPLLGRLDPRVLINSETLFPSTTDRFNYTTLTIQRRV